MIFRLLNFQYLDHLCIFNTAFQSFYVNEGCEFLVIKGKVSDYIICELLPIQPQMQQVMVKNHGCTYGTKTDVGVSQEQQN